MTERADPLPRTPSLLQTILLGTVLCAVVTPALQWLTLTIFHDTPNPDGSVWLGYLLIQAVSGACVGAALYAVGRRFQDPLRWYASGVLFCLLIGGDLHDYVRRSLGEYLAFWAASALMLGVVMGALLHATDRRGRARAARADG
jgi:hypothetical protein